MNGFLIPFVELVRYVIYLYEILLIVSVVLSWLITFGHLLCLNAVINLHDLWFFLCSIRELVDTNYYPVPTINFLL